MRKNIEDFLFNECIKYLGKYPATKNKLVEIINKKKLYGNEYGSKTIR